LLKNIVSASAVGLLTIVREHVVLRLKKVVILNSLYILNHVGIALVTVHVIIAALVPVLLTICVVVALTVLVGAVVSCVVPLTTNLLWKENWNFQV
jgi:hypothetical protein